MGFANQAALALDAAKLSTRATRDALTGLYSRHFAEATLERELGRASRSRARTSILFLDLDRFKTINDEYGHATGDEALRSVAHCLSRLLRHSDLIGRWGGEEFIVILSDTGPEAALKVALKLRATLAQELASFRPGRGITVSIGVASRDPEKVVSSRSLLDQADRALYEAKRQGRNRVVVSE
jgi:diguanylate cyclase (GGDEF)-like protein